MVYLATSKISLVIMGNFAVACTYLCYNLLISVFFGRLNDSEWANIAEKMPRAIVETGLAMMAFADDFG